MKLQIRTIDLENYMHDYILSPREGYNMVNVVVFFGLQGSLDGLS